MQFARPDITGSLFYHIQALSLDYFFNKYKYRIEKQNRFGVRNALEERVRSTFLQYSQYKQTPLPGNVVQDAPFMVSSVLSCRDNNRTAVFSNTAVKHDVKRMPAPLSCVKVPQDSGSLTPAYRTGAHNCVT